MARTQNPKALTLRLKPEIHAAIADVARRRSQSINAYIQANLETIVRAEKEQARYDAYTMLGQDAESCEAEYAIHAQIEVMLHGEL